MRGKIIKGIAGFYSIAWENQVYTCKAKGLFRNSQTKPLVGDEVEFVILHQEDLEGHILEIHPRRNCLIRPQICNIDRILVVLAVERPIPRLRFLDKYLIRIEQEGIPCSILWNKVDLDPSAAREFAAHYRPAGYESLFISTQTGEGVEALREFIRGKTVALAGPSGVGKSSITNALCPGAGMETKEVSRKIERGRHTTRHSELFLVEENTYICDTPGFSMIEIESMEEARLKSFYGEFQPYEEKCQFSGCRHISEPGCRVRQALLEDGLSPIRYENYCRIYMEIAERNKYSY